MKTGDTAQKSSTIAAVQSKVNFTFLRRLSGFILSIRYRCRPNGTTGLFFKYCLPEFVHGFIKKHALAYLKKLENTLILIKHCIMAYMYFKLTLFCQKLTDLIIFLFGMNDLYNLLKKAYFFCWFSKFFFQKLHHKNIKNIYYLGGYLYILLFLYKCYIYKIIFLFKKLK